jgi:hypothetical protein
VAGELSPDKQHYWDGVRWTRAVSPDGAWQWDGSSWQPSSSGLRKPRLGLTVAAIVVVAVVVTSFGLFKVGHWVIAKTQSYLQTNGVGVACPEAGAKAGAPLAEGDVLCGRHLGASYIRIDCLAPGTPSSGQFLDAVGDGSWESVTETSDGSGCPLDAQPNHERMLSSVDQEPASSTLVVDFTAQGWEGGVGVQVACSERQSCIDFSLFGDGYWSLDQGNTGNKFDNLTSGQLGTFTGSRVPETGTAYRIIIRLSGRAAEVFLDGRELTHASATVDQGTGFATFYVDGRDTTNGESVDVQRMFLFETLSS